MPLHINKTETIIGLVGIGVSILGIVLFKRSQSSAAKSAQDQAAQDAALFSDYANSVPMYGSASGSSGGAGGSIDTNSNYLDGSSGATTQPSGSTAPSAAQAVNADLRPSVIYQNGVPFLSNGDGTLTGILGTQLDITAKTTSSPPTVPGKNSTTQTNFSTEHPETFSPNGAPAPFGTRGSTGVDVLDTLGGLRSGAKSGYTITPTEGLPGGSILPGGQDHSPIGPFAPKVPPVNPSTWSPFTMRTDTVAPTPLPVHPGRAS